MIHHGGNIYAASRRTGIPAERIIDFSASINPMGVPENAAHLLAGEIESLPHYPEPYSEGLAAAIAGKLGLREGAVICGNGSTELVYLVPRALKPKKVLIVAPTFGEYERACRNIGAEIVIHGLGPNGGFELDPGAFVEAMSGCNMAFLCNPNNPTGRLVEKERVLKIAEAARRLACLLVVDEAFIDFCPAASVAGKVETNPWLVVLRSMTKFYALSGLRIGYGVFHAEVRERVMAYKEPWTVNTLAQKAAAAAIGDGAFEAASLSAMKREKSFMEAALAAMGVDFIPSAANYYLLKVAKGREVASGLEKRGILVRDCSSFEGLDGTYLRVAVRSRRENERLLSEMADICAHSR